MSEYHKAIEQSTVSSDQFLNLKEVFHDGLLSFCTAAGIAALYAVMEEDVANMFVAKGKHIPERQAYWHGTEATSVTIAGTNTPINRPRVRRMMVRKQQLKAMKWPETVIYCARWL